MRGEQERECTFQPEPRERADLPSLDEFLKKQQDHLKRVKQFRLDKQKEEENSELGTLQNKPSINDSSRVLAQRLPSTRDRLLAKRTKLTSKSPAREKAEKRAGIGGSMPVFLSSIHPPLHRRSSPRSTSGLRSLSERGRSRRNCTRMRSIALTASKRTALRSPPRRNRHRPTNTW